MEKMKEYARRDSCTAILKKMGVDKKDYNFFIDKMGDKFMCRTDKAARHLEQLKELATKGAEAPAKVNGARVLKPKKTVGVKKDSVSKVARELISVGRTNEEVWGALKARFNLDDKKKHYPAWYRAEMIRSGQLPKPEVKK